MNTTMNPKRKTGHMDEYVVNANEAGGRDLLALKHGEAFLLHVNTSVMEQAGVAEGDIVVINKQKKPANQNIVIAEVDGDLLIRKLESAGNKQRLVTPSMLSPMEMDGRAKIVGVVTYVIKRMVSCEPVQTERLHGEWLSSTGETPKRLND